MAVLLAEDRDFKVDDAVIALGELRDLDGGAVGDFLIEAFQQFFTHKLGADLALGLVGDHVVREKVRAFDRVLLQLI